MSDENNSADASFMLIAVVTFVITVFYMVNASNKQIRNCTWSLINLGTSIFIAVLTYNLVDTVITWLCEIEDANPPTFGNLMSSIVQLVCWWYLLVCVLGFVSSSPLHLAGYGTVGGHIMGFAALNVFGNLNLMDGFNNSAWMTWVVILIAIVSLALLFGSSKLVGAMMSKMGCIDDEDMDRWHDQSLDSGNDFFALCLGFLLTMFLRCLITGAFPSVDGELGGVESASVWWLVFAGLIVLLLAAGAKYALHGMHKAEKKKNQKEGSTMASKSVELLSSSLSNAAAFSFVFAGMWLVGNNESVEVLALVLNAFLLSFSGICFVLASSMVHKLGALKRTLKGIFTAISLAVGYSWEKTFDGAMDGLSDLDWFSGSADKAKTLKFFFTLGLILLAFPAWMVYIMPKDNDDVKKALKSALAKGSLPCRAVCCDEDLYDEELSDQEVTTTYTTAPVQTMAAPVQTMAAPAPSFQYVQTMAAPQYAYQSVPAESARSVTLLQPTTAMNVN